MSKQDLHRTIFCLDNLEVLREMDSESIDLIYLDPPFNKKQIFNAPLKGGVKKDVQKYFQKFNELNYAHGHQFYDGILRWKADFEQPSFEDTWESEPDVRRGEEWMLKQDEAEGIKECVFAYLGGLQDIRDKKCLPKGHLSYLCFMAVRLVEMHRILKDTGSIYLHCDPTMSHYLKTLMDMIFGVENFRNEIVWYYSQGIKSSTDKELSNHDYVLGYYKKISRYHPTIVPYTEKQLKRFKYQDKKGKFYLDTRRDSKGEKKRVKVYLKKEGTPAGDVWYFPHVQGQEYTGYPTQKPLALLERIIQASSKEGDVVLDPFCGCATACVASYRLNRKYIGIDISEAAFMLLMYRIGQEAGWGKKQGELDLSAIQDRLPKLSFKSPTPSKRQKSPEVRYVYLISSPYFIKNNLYKVGIAADVEKRKKAYNTGDPGRTYEIIYSKLCANFREVEKAVIQKFPSAHPKAKGEWIRGEKEAIIAFIENLIHL